MQMTLKAGITALAGILVVRSKRERGMRQFPKVTLRSVSSAAVLGRKISFQPSLIVIGCRLWRTDRWFLESNVHLGRNAGHTGWHVIDQAYSQWHSDGTEIMNSSRPPV